MIVSTLSANEEQALRTLKKSLFEQFPIISMRLYGSRARGDGDTDSDIDVMIELNDRNFKIERDIFDIIYNVNLEFDILIMPLFISRKLIVEGPMSQSPVYKAALREGITL